MEVLFIKDDPSTIAVTCVCLEIYKPKVTLINANMGFPVIEMVKTEQPDCIIRDLDPPDISSAEVLKKLRSSTRTEEQVQKRCILVPTTTLDNPSTLWTFEINLIKS